MPRWTGLTTWWRRSSDEKSALHRHEQACTFALNEALLDNTMDDRSGSSQHKGKQVLLVDISHCTAAELVRRQDT